MDTEETLRLALLEGRVVTILFNGGDRPGAARDILPLRFDDRYGPMVHCWCLETCSDKGFRINAISLPAPGQRIWYYNDVERIAWLDDWGPNPNPAAMQWPADVADDPSNDTSPFALLALLWQRRFQPLIEAAGFEVELGATRIFVHELFKNGRRRRSHIHIDYCPTMQAQFIDEDGHAHPVERPVAQAWVADNNRYRSMAHAFVCFTASTEAMLAGLVT